MVIETLWDAHGCFLSAQRTATGGFDWRRSASAWARHDPTLILGLQLGPRGIEDIVIGPSTERGDRQQALQKLFGLDATSPAPLSVPPAVRARVIEQIRSAVHTVTNGYGAYGTENHITGAFFQGIVADWKEDGWHVMIRQQQYSSNVKEPIIGADAGIIIEIEDGHGGRVVKAAWLQAKRIDFSRAPFHDPRLEQQLERMLSRTEEAYAVLYGADGVQVQSALTPGIRQSFEEWFDQLVDCSRGDRAWDVVVDTLDRAQLLSVSISG